MNTTGACFKIGGGCDMVAWSRKVPSTLHMQSTVMRIWYRDTVPDGTFVTSTASTAQELADQSLAYSRWQAIEPVAMPLVA